MPESSGPQAVGQWTGRRLFGPNPQVAPELFERTQLALRRANKLLREQRKSYGRTTIRESAQSERSATLLLSMRRLVRKVNPMFCRNRTAAQRPNNHIDVDATWLRRPVAV